MRTAIAAMCIVVATAAVVPKTHAYEAMYAKTAVDEIEIKQLPAATLLATTQPGSYFDRDNDMFRRLFRYIRDHDVSMTVPVEATVDEARMLFYVGQTDRDKQLADQGPVQVIRLPARTVLSIGMRGAYTRSRFERGRERLRQWLRDNPGYRSAGDPYAVYWDSPFVPWFLKRSEVHIPLAVGSED